VYEDRRVEILPRLFRELQSNPTEPQYFDDVSLERVSTVLAKELKIVDHPKIRGSSSLGPVFELKDDGDLTVALLLFVYAD
jgi:hypothetical protein